MDETQAQPAEYPFAPSVGARLAEARKAQKLSLDEVAARSRVPVRHLEAIESGDHTALPAATYSVGFVRTYAQLLGLDAAALASDFRAEIGQRPDPRKAPEPFEPADPARVPPRLLALVALVIALLLAGGYAIWRAGLFGGDDAGTRAQLAAGIDGSAPAPAARIAAPQPATPPAAPATGPVTLTATDTVWLRVYEKGGDKLLEKQMAAGDTWQVPPTAREPEILTGRPQALRVTVGAAVIPPLGAPEKRIKDVSLKPEDLLARLKAQAPAPLPPAAAAPARPPAVETLTPVDSDATPLAAPPAGGNGADPGDG